MIIPAEITAINALRDTILQENQNRSGHLDVAAGALQAAAENLQWHQDKQAKQESEKAELLQKQTKVAKVGEETTPAAPSLTSSPSLSAEASAKADFENPAPIK